MNASKIIKGVVGGGRWTITAPIVKEDYGLYLKIEGIELPASYEVDFSNSEHNGTSVTMIGNSDGVLIPSQFIKSGKDVFAFLYHVGEDFGRTIYKFRIPNKLRPDRTDEEPTPEEQSVIDQAISALNSAVEQTAQDVETTSASAQSAGQSAISADESAQSAQQSLTALTEYGDQAIQELLRITEEVNTSATNASDSAEASAQSAQSASQSAQTAQDALEEFTTPTASATTLPEGSNATASYANGHFDFGIPRGDKGERGERGLQGIQGERGLQGETGQAGRDGTDGTDGISPTVTITPITGGHRITITDADGEHSADVMDGTGNVDDVQINGQSIVSDGVANVPMMTGSVYGVSKSANTTEIKGGLANNRSVTANNAYVASFFGLAKAASDTTQSSSRNAVGVYTEDAKSKISEMLGGSVSVSGTTPTIVAKSGIRYVCGEVATLDFTPSQTGICDVVFTSGSTPTVVTLPSTVKFPDGSFVAEADTTYEINILDGIYGAVMAWT